MVGGDPLALEASLVDHMVVGFLEAVAVDHMEVVMEVMEVILVVVDHTVGVVMEAPVVEEGSPVEASSVAGLAMAAWVAEVALLVEAALLVAPPVVVATGAPVDTGGLTLLAGPALALPGGPVVATVDHAKLQTWCPPATLGMTWKGGQDPGSWLASVQCVSEVLSSCDSK